MNRTLKLISVLLSYPEPNLSTVREEFHAAVAADSLLPRGDRVLLDTLIDELCGLDTLEAQERYVRLFDRTRSLSLHLFEHVHGESRDRGQAMVDLIALYEAGGFSPTATELPDYLPLFLEYAATRKPQDALDLIGQPAHVLAALKERLAKRQSPYADIFAALVAMTKVRLDQAALAALQAEPDPEPDDLAALDAAWEEEEVLFGPGAAACGKDSIVSKVRQAQRPAPGMPVHAPGTQRPVVTTSRAIRN